MSVISCRFSSAVGFKLVYITRDTEYAWQLLERDNQVLREIGPGVLQRATLDSSILMIKIQ